jgi:Uma2 family endonuclease
MATLISTIDEEREPVWEIAHLFPDQGAWEEEDYLGLETNRLVEFYDGFVEVLPMPTTPHQLIVGFLYSALSSFVSQRKQGIVAHAPLKVRVRSGKFREPDVIFMQAQHVGRIGKRYWQGADLVIEVVSEDEESRRRDYKTKPLEYAEAGIPEYWIVDPHKRKIIVLRLEGQDYVVHGEFVDGHSATSKLLPGFEIDATSVFEAGKIPGAPDA